MQDKRPKISLVRRLRGRASTPANKQFYHPSLRDMSLVYPEEEDEITALPAIETTPKLNLPDTSSDASFYQHTDRAQSWDRSEIDRNPKQPTDQQHGLLKLFKPRRIHDNPLYAQSHDYCQNSIAPFQESNYCESTPKFDLARCEAEPTLAIEDYCLRKADAIHCPLIEPSGGTAARAAAAAQNELLYQIRGSRSETNVDHDNESGIGVERSEDATGPDGDRVKRLDPTTALPPELINAVLGFLDSLSIMNVEQVSWNWYRAASTSHTWKQVFMADFPPARLGTEAKHTHAPGLSRPSYGTGLSQQRSPREDWKGMWRARKALDQRWRDGHAAAIYLEGHTDSVYCVQFDEDIIVTGSRDRTVRIWSTRTFETLNVLGQPSRASNALASLSDHADEGKRPFARVFPPRKKAGAVTAANQSDLSHTGSVLCLKYDDELLVTGSSDRSVIVWQAQANYNYDPVKRLEGHDSGVLDVGFDGKHIVSCSRDTTILVWHRQTGECLRRMLGHSGPVNALELRGDLLVSASGDGYSKLWNLTSGLCIKEFSNNGRAMACVAFSQDARTIFAGGNERLVYQFDANTGELVRTLQGHGKMVRSVFLDDGNGRIVSGSYDTSVKVFDLVTGEALVSFDNWTASWILCAKADHRRIVATGHDSRVVIMDFGYDLAGVDLL